MSERLDAVERANQRWYSRQEETKLGSGRGTQARIERRMVGYKEPAWRKKHLSEEEQQRRDWLRAQGMRDTSQDQKYMPDALRKQKLQELEAVCAGKPWLRRNWPMIMDTRPGGQYINFTGVISGGYDAAPVEVASEESFLTYAAEWLKMGNIHPAELAEMHSFVATAQAIVDARTKKEESREISNQNLQDTREEDSALRQEWKDKAVTRNVNFGSGFLPMLTAYRALEQKRYFRAFDLTLSKKQEDAISSRSDGTGYNLMMKQLPDLDGTDATKHAVLNAVLFNPSRWYGLQALIESGNASKSYTDDEGVVRSISTNKARPKDGFDSSKFED